MLDIAEAALKENAARLRLDVQAHLSHPQTSSSPAHPPPSRTRAARPAAVSLVSAIISPPRLRVAGSLTGCAGRVGGS
jgi:hypothetical protein